MSNNQCPISNVQRNSRGTGSSRLHILSPVSSLRFIVYCLAASAAKIFSGVTGIS